MPVNPTVTDDVVSKATTVALAPLLSITGTTNPAYLVVTALDRDEYTAAASQATGEFKDGGTTVPFSPIGSDGRGAGIVFTWQAGQGGQAGQYVNATYGSLSNLDFVTSSSAGDVTSISLFTTTNLALATQDANSAISLVTQDAAGYDGSITFVTSAHPYVPAAATAPSSGGTLAATPDGVAAAAESFVGQAWNDNGCWVLASTIAAEAGAGLPVQSTAIGVAGHANGAWVVVYDGPVQSSANWISKVTTGDIVLFGTPGGGGHITTCVSGSGATAMLVDNITYENQYGQITNSAHDGSPNDVTIEGPHSASQEWAGVAANSVVIYALDTPVVTPASTTAVSLSNTGRVSLGAIASISDPAGKAVTQIQVYDSGSHLTFLLNGATQTGISAAHPLTAASLAAVTVVAGTGLTSDTLEVRASNGTYWGDWEPITVKAAGSAAPVGHLTVQDWPSGRTDPTAHSDRAALHTGMAGRDILGGWHSVTADAAVPVLAHFPA